MAKEILHGDAGGLKLYFQLVSSAGTYWNGSALESYSAAHVANYALPLMETASSGQYFGDMPAVFAGRYRIVVYLQTGGSPAPGDIVMDAQEVVWDGAAIPSLEEIKAKTDLISAGGITVVSPLTDSGNLLTLVAGDDYYYAHGRAIDFVSNDYPDLSGASCVLRIISRDTNAPVFTIDGTIVDARTLRYEIPREKTALLAPANVGTYIYSSRATFPDGQIATQKRGQVLVLNG